MTAPKLIYKDNNFIVINKPAGLLVHKSVLNREDLNPQEKTLVDWLIQKYPEIKKVGDDTINRPGIVHRLDRETSGVMIVPLNQKYFAYFKKLFQNHEIKKTYVALVYGNIRNEKGVINKPIGIKSGTTKRSVHSSKMSKEAITEFEVIKRYKFQNQDLTLLRIHPKTGRTHQIRVHLASILCPVVGDKLYGRKKELFPELGRQFLHAESIEFPAKGGSASGGKNSKVKSLKFKTALPNDLKKVLKNLL